MLAAFNTNVIAKQILLNTLWHNIRNRKIIVYPLQQDLECGFEKSCYQSNYLYHTQILAYSILLWHELYETLTKKT
jgi:hypothetical protein